MKILGIILVTLFSTLTISHSHKTQAIIEEVQVPVQYRPAVDCDEVQYGAVRPVFVAVAVPSPSFQKNVGPASYDAAPVGSYAPNAGPVGYEGVPVGVPISYKKNVGPVSYDSVPVGPYGQNAGPVVHEKVPVGPYEQNAGPVAYESVPSSAYQNKEIPDGYEVVLSGYASSPSRVSGSYQKNVGPAVYETVPSDVPLSYQKYGVPASYVSVPSGYNSVPSGAFISYEKNVGTGGSYVPTDASASSSRPVYQVSEGATAVIAPSQPVYNYKVDAPAPYEIRPYAPAYRKVAGPMGYKDC